MPCVGVWETLCVFVRIAEELELRFRYSLSSRKFLPPPNLFSKRLMENNPPPQRAYSSPRKFVYIVRQMIDVDDDRRKCGRVPKRVTLSIQPLNDDFAADGEPFYAISSDISRQGISFISDDPIVHEYVRVMLLEEDVSVIAKVRHSTSIGTQYPLYLVGVEFLDEYLV